MHEAFLEPACLLIATGKSKHSIIYYMEGWESYSAPFGWTESSRPDRLTLLADDVVRCR